MATKITKNSFQGGMDKDTDPRQLDPSKYTDAYMASISVDGKDGQLTAFKGIKNLEDLLLEVDSVDHTKLKVMGMYEARVLLGASASAQVETLMGLLFVYDIKTLSFYVFAVEEDGTKYIMYKKVLTSDEAAEYASDGRYFVDCKIYKEAGTSYAYFTDGVFEPKKLKLDIIIGGKGDGTGVLPAPTRYYTNEEVQLVRTGFRGNVSGVSVLSGGELLCGTYQFAMRLANNTEKKYTKWSLLTNPVFIGFDETTTSKSYGGTGYISSNKITLTLESKEDYTSLYTHYQIAVVENINGGDDSTLTVKLLQPEDISGFTSTTTFDYESNKPAKELVSIDEVTVDDAQIKAFNTLEIKNNRLIPANVKYHPLDYDNDEPSVANNTIPLLKPFTDDGITAYSDADNSSSYVGYFRDELYRFGVVYEDKYGNFSKPKILNFSSCGANQAGGGIDWKFPMRNDGLYGTLLDGSNDIQALGLSIKSLVNHPSWAIAVHIVRVPRKKKIQFQSPLVPSILVQPAKADGSYPDQRYSYAESDLDILNVEAANPDGTFIPKNFFHVLPKNMVRFGDVYENSGDSIGVFYVSHNNSTISKICATTPSTNDEQTTYVYQDQELIEIYDTQSSTVTAVFNKEYSVETFNQGEQDEYDEWSFVGFGATDVGRLTLKRRLKTGGGTFSAYVEGGFDSAADYVDGVAVGYVDVSTLGGGGMEIKTGGDMDTVLDLTTYDYLLEFTDS